MRFMLRQALPRALPHLILGAFFLLFALPLLSILHAALWTDPEAEALWTQGPARLWGLVRTTLLLGSSAALIATLLGTAAAWAVTRLDLPGRRLLSLLLCLPLALPTYILAGIAASLARAGLLPAPQNLPGAALLFGLSLYPWVYLPVKATLAQRSRIYHEAAQTLGLGPWRRLFHVHLPLLAPTAAVTALLVFMAVLHDYGTAYLLGVKTLGIGIHDTMFGDYRRDWAAQLSLLGLAVPVLAALLFGLLNARRGAYNPANRGAPVPRRRLAAPARWGVAGALVALLGAALLLPVGTLLLWASRFVGRIPLTRLPARVLDTLLVTALVTLLTVALALAINLLIRRGVQGRSRWLWTRLRLLPNLNYAMPGIMLAIALLFLAGSLPEAAARTLLSNTPALLVIAGCLGYICFPFFAIQAGLETLPREMDDLCAVLAIPPARRLWTIDLPLLRRYIACGALLVLVIMAKDVALSVRLQPFGFQSLSMRVFAFAEPDMDLLEESALFSLALVALVLYPVVALDRLVMGSADATA